MFSIEIQPTHGNATLLGIDMINGTKFLSNQADICDDIDGIIQKTMPASAITDLQANLDGGAGWWAISTVMTNHPNRTDDTINIRFDENFVLPDPWAPFCDGGGECNDAGPVWLVMNYTLTPEPVNDLTQTGITHDTINLDWNTPTWYGWNHESSITGYDDLLGYQVNRSAPGGGSPIIIETETTDATTSFTVTGLTQNTEYDFRVSAITRGGQYSIIDQINASGNILNLETISFFSIVNFTNLDFNRTNTNEVAIFFTRTDVNSTVTEVTVDRPEFYNLGCNVSYKFQQTTDTFLNLPTVALSPSTDRSTFSFIEPEREVITIFCFDQSGSDTGRYVMTQTFFPFLDQIADFRAGEFGTGGALGAFDMIALFAVVLTMMSLNRFNEAVGIIVSIALIGSLYFFEVVSFNSVILSGLVLVVMLGIITVRKKG